MVATQTQKINEWYITQEALNSINEQSYNIEGKADNNKARRQAIFAKYWYSPEVNQSDKIAIISISGALYEEDYKVFASLIEKAESDENIEKILLDINSPGGQVSGVFDACSIIRNCSKPTASYTSTMMCSAAYAIGCSVDTMYATKQASVGSIGVLVQYLDYSKMQEKMGIREVIFKAKHSEKKNLSPETEEGKKAIQDKIDIAEQFLHEHIASARNIDVQDVLDNFGHGEVFYGNVAQERGMVDTIVENFDNCMSIFKDSTQQAGGEDGIMTLDEMKAKDPDAYAKLMGEAQALAKADVDRQVEQAQAKERERINMIDTFSKLEAIEGVSDLFAKAKSDGTSIEKLKVKAFDVILANYKEPVVEKQNEKKEVTAGEKELEVIAKEDALKTPQIDAKQQQAEADPFLDSIDALADAVNEYEKEAN